MMERTLIRTDDMGEYEVRVEMWKYHPDEPPMEMTSAYTKSGDYIGEPDRAAYLASEGIAPELRTPTSNVCTIGYSALTQRWYGWSHRAMAGFAVGDKLTTDLLDASEFPPGTILRTLDDAKRAAMAFAASVS